MNSNWFKFFVASQINCQLQSLRCYYAKELKKTKSSKKKKVDLIPMKFTHQNGHTLQFWIAFSESKLLQDNRSAHW